MGEVTIRTLTPDDWEIFRALRIRALELHSELFSQTPHGARAQSKEHWLNTLNGDGKAVFGLFDDAVLIGITAVFTWRERLEGDTGYMAMSFIEPEYRGKGYSALFYKARMEFALSYLPWKTLHIAHRAGNEPSRRAILKHGFEFIGTQEIDWPDGERDLEYMYEMNLEKRRT